MNTNRAFRLFAQNIVLIEALKTDGAFLKQYASLPRSNRMFQEITLLSGRVNKAGIRFHEWFL